MGRNALSRSSTFQAQGPSSRPPSDQPGEAAGSNRLGKWELNTVYPVDCLDGLKAIPADSFDVAVTSPPYWGQRGANGIGSEEDPRDYVRNLVDVLAEVMRCLKPTGTLWLNIGDAYNTPINWREDDHEYSSLGPEGRGLAATNSAYTKKRGRRRAFTDKRTPWLQYGNLLALPYRIVIAMCDLGCLFRGEVVWVKSRPMPEGLCRRPHRRHEGIYVFAKDERHAFTTKPPVGSTWELVQTPNTTPHCSTFPLDLPRRCILAAGCPEPGLVLDPFMGSGTTGMAAVALGHKFLGFELNQENCRLANQRINGPERDQRHRATCPSCHATTEV
jgi:DNA modification methylase